MHVYVHTTIMQACPMSPQTYPIPVPWSGGARGALRETEGFAGGERHTRLWT